MSLRDVEADPIRSFDTDGVVLAGGERIDLDDVVLATGFDAMTGSMLKVDIRGTGGLSLRQEWAGGPRNYLGLAIPGFPNLFMITGPGSPSVPTNMIVATE